MFGRWSRAKGTMAATGKETLQVELQTATNSGVLDIPEDLIAPILEASRNAADRPVIMNHLYDCLSKPSGKQWQRTYAGLTLLENLLTCGSFELLAEAAFGRHFDLRQRLAFLEHFDFDNRRVQAMMKGKIENLRNKAMPRLGKVQEMADSCKETSTEMTFYVRRPLNNTRPGVAFRNSKSREDIFHSDNIAFYDSFVRGIDEGDGWLRVGNTFLPFDLPSGERVLVTFQDSNSLEDGTLSFNWTVQDELQREEAVANVSKLLEDMATLAEEEVATGKHGEEKEEKTTSGSGRSTPRGKFSKVANLGTAPQAIQTSDEAFSHVIGASSSSK